MNYYVLVNQDKEARARGVVTRKGTPPDKRADRERTDYAECNLYDRARLENSTIKDDDLIIAVYRGLGGKVEEFPTQKEADARADELKLIRIKQSKKDAKALES